MKPEFRIIAGHSADKPTNNEWYSPKWIFEALDVEFDLDVCAPEGGVYWIPAKEHYSLKDDGLTKDWAGKRVWMNPPYSNPLPWTTKFLQNGNGIALLPTTIGKWWLELWNDPRTYWLPLKPVKFLDPNEKEARQTMPSRNWLVAIGKINIMALEESNLGLMR